MSSILIGSTIPAFAMTAESPTWHHWLENAEQITDEANALGHTVEWIAVLQVDGRGVEPFEPLLRCLDELPADEMCTTTFWEFSVDTGARSITSSNRLASICVGRNLMIERALQRGHEWIYFADSDISAPNDVLPRLLELDWPVCGGHVPTYCLDGPRYRWDVRPEIDVRTHWNTAGSLLVRRDVFRRVPWRHDPDAGLTDDPATQGEMEMLGFPTLVRHDVICTHHPESIAALEHRDVDLAVYR